jgi:carbamoyl-phosphate synthase large subunit
MNPRVSRSSALASKATGFPIAKIAAKLAVGLTLDEIPNDITRVTPASFEPTIDYVVTKIPRFAFEKFPETDPTLTTQMKSVGEAMAIGRTFKESLQKALRSLETDLYGLEPLAEATDDEVVEKLKTPNALRVLYVAEALRRGFSVKEVSELTMIDPWFVDNIREIVEFEGALKDKPLDRDTLQRAKEMGFSDRRLAAIKSTTEDEVRSLRDREGLWPVYKRVDTCAAEFEAYTPYLYSTYERPFYNIGEQKARPECEALAITSDKQKVVILGGGPNRIGQGIEFDYCCVHAVFALKELGYETIMINCNPETVSTDYDTADKLYFEPLTLEDVLGVIRKENPVGVIVQFGGQTPLKLAVPLERQGVRILGTTPDAIDRAEDRERFSALLRKLGLRQPENGIATDEDTALRVAESIGYPVVVRPSYVLGGRAMEIVFDEDSLRRYIREAVKASPEHPILIDKYLIDAVEVDVDAVGDGQRVIVGGVMEHIEEAGIHSGDSACVIPPYSLPEDIVQQIKAQTRALALELGVVGLMNVQFAVKDGQIYVLEVNPRASRTVPYVSKAIGVPLAKVAAKVMVGKGLEELGLTEDPQIGHVAVKEAVFPFDRFPGVDPLLGPEMKSTGEVMGIDVNFGVAYAKAEASARNRVPDSGKVFISVRDEDKSKVLEVAKGFLKLGFPIVATRGTAAFLSEHGLEVEVINKLKEGRPNVVDLIKNQEIGFIINTVESARARKDSYYIRESALRYGVPYTTTISGARAVVKAIEALRQRGPTIKSLQQYHQRAEVDVN